MIPIVFSVHRTNNKVLSLFGYIPIDEINELAGRCERYIQKYLDEYQERRDFSMEKSADDQENSSKREHNENTYFEVNANESMNPENIKLNISEGEGLEAKVAQYNKDLNNGGTTPNLNVPNDGLGKHLGDKSSLQDDKLGKSMDKSSALDMKTVKEEEKKNEDDENLAIDRTQKLLNSKDNNKKTVIIQFLAVTLLFAIWFILNYVDLNILLTRVRVCLGHLRLLSQRTPDVRFVLAFSLEELAENNKNSVYLYPDQSFLNLRQDYMDRVFQNDQELFNSLDGDFPSTFDSYKSAFEAYNLQDLCQNYYKIVDPSDYSKCINISNGLLQKGLRIAITSILQNTDDVIKDFYITDRSNISQILEINSDKFVKAEQILDEISPAMYSLITTYLDAFQSYIDGAANFEKFKFAIFLVGLFLVFILIWVPYLRNLSNKIFRTKGMLNMIPMEIISKNENLKNLFISGDLLQAVK